MKITYELVFNHQKKLQEEITRLFDINSFNDLFLKDIDNLDNKMDCYVLYQNINYFNKNIISERKQKILDLGSGSGFKTYLLSKLYRKSKIYSLDTKIHDFISDDKLKMREVDKQVTSVFKKTIRKNKNIMEKKYYQGVHFPYKDNFFDIVFLYAVIEHLEKKRRKEFINEIKRVLKKGGILFIARCPRKLSLTENLSKILGIPSHPSLMDMNEIHDLLDNDFVIKNSMRLDNTICFPKKLVNKFSTILLFIDRIAQNSKLNFWAHDISLVSIKKIRSVPVNKS